MILAAILLQASAVEAERAFAADAQAVGQWTAFRKWAADDATLFLPQPAKAQDFLRSLKDPAKSVDWWPVASFVSCDGKVAANTGGAIWPDGHASYFSTIWSRQAPGRWRWTVDHGDDLKATRPRPTAPALRRADCTRKPVQMAYIPVAGERSAAGTSPDGTLAWNWSVKADGARRFNVALWNGRAWEVVIRDLVAAPR